MDIGVLQISEWITVIILAILRNKKFDQEEKNKDKSEELNDI